MKKHLLSISFLLLVMGTISLDGQDFRTLYGKLDSLPNINKLVYNGAVRPSWVDSLSFWYETRDAQGPKYYYVDIAAASKTEISKEKVDELLAKHPIRRPGEWDPWYNWKQEPIPSPDGKFEASLKDSNIWVKEVSTGKEFAVTTTGTQGDFFYSFLWSPDSKKIAAIKRLDVKERQIPLVESSPKDQFQPKLSWLNYAKPGDALPIDKPVLVNVETKTEIAVDSKPFENHFNLYISGWREDSGSFTFDYNQRGHQVYQVVRVDAQTGQTKILVDERSNTFIYYNMVYTHFINNDTEFIWASERDNWRHLYLYDAATGELKRQLTKGEWNVRDIYDGNEEEGTILFSANGMNTAIAPYAGKYEGGEDPYNIHLYKLSIADGAIKALTPEEGNHLINFSRDKKFFVDVYSTPEVPPVSVVRSTADGSIVLSLQKADISALKKSGWTTPEVFVAKGRDGLTDIWGTIYRPLNFNPKKKYPVVEYIYAGPHDSHVLKDFYAYTRFNKLMELGFIVVTIDGMGTDNRSKEFQDVAFRNLKDAGFPDRILWMQAAASKYKHMDISNVGIYGYSAGGQNSLTALLFFPDFYKVAVALCGCHDNRMDKIWWNEQWMGYPIGPWYSECSNIDNAYRLEGKLLLINGEIDNNVDPTSTLKVVKALIDANKDFQQYYLPGYTHNLGDEWITRHVFEFFYNNIKVKK